MTVAQAQHILGLSGAINKDQLDAKRRELILKYHPDRPGGNAAKAAEVNAAYDVIKATFGRSFNTSTGASNFDFEKAEKEKKNAAYKKLAIEMFYQHFKPENFVKHFESLFGGRFTYRISDDSHKPARWYDTSTHMIVEFNGPDTVIDWSVSMNYADFVNQKSLAASAESIVDMSMSISILHARRKIKINRQGWTIAKEPTLLRNPSVLFPADKFRQAVKKDTARKYSKRDAVATISRELSGRVESSGDGMQAWIPVAAGQRIDSSWKILIYRHTMMGMATWAFNGLYKVTRQSMGATCFVMEVPEEMNILVDHIKGFQQHHGSTTDRTKLVSEFLAMTEAVKRDIAAHRAKAKTE